MCVFVCVCIFCVKYGEYLESFTCAASPSLAHVMERKWWRWCFHSSFSIYFEQIPILYSIYAYVFCDCYEQNMQIRKFSDCYNIASDTRNMWHDDVIICKSKGNICFWLNKTIPVSKMLYMYICTFLGDGMVKKADIDATYMHPECLLHLSHFLSAKIFVNTETKTHTQEQWFMAKINVTEISKEVFTIAEKTIQVQNSIICIQFLQFSVSTFDAFRFSFSHFAFLSSCLLLILAYRMTQRKNKHKSECFFCGR